MTTQPYGVPSCWSRQFEENDAECDSCAHRDTCKPQFLRSRGMAGTAAPPPPPPGGWQQPQAPPVAAPAQHHAAYYPPSTPQPQSITPTSLQPLQPLQRFWPTPQAHYFEPHKGEGTGERLAKNATLAMSASFFETLSYFFRTWRWPRADK